MSHFAVYQHISIFEINYTTLSHAEKKPAPHISHMWPWAGRDTIRALCAIIFVSVVYNPTCPGESPRTGLIWPHRGGKSQLWYGIQL